MHVHVTKQDHQTARRPGSSYTFEQRSLGGKNRAAGVRFSNRHRDFLMIQLRAEGWTLRAIAEEVKCHFTTVWRIVQGIAPRCLTLEETKAIPWSIKAVLRVVSPRTLPQSTRATVSRLKALVWPTGPCEFPKHHRPPAELCPACGGPVPGNYDEVLEREREMKPYLLGYNPDVG